jgi:hypothetical protein
VKRVLLIIILCFSFFSVCEAAGDWWGILEGEVGIGQSPLVDPAPSDPPAVYFVIKGDAARRMYEKMNEDTFIKDQSSCEEGVVTKIIGDLQCSRNGLAYVCDVGIDLNSGKSVVGRSC